MKPLSPEKQMVKDTLDSGISPIVFDYQDVVFFQKEHHIIRTFMDEKDGIELTIQRTEGNADVYAAG